MFGITTGTDSSGILTFEVLMWLVLSAIALLLLRKNTNARLKYVKCLIIYLPSLILSYMSGYVRNFNEIPSDSSFIVFLLIIVQLLIAVLLLKKIFNFDLKPAIILNIKLFFVAAFIVVPIIFFGYLTLVPKNIQALLP
jgi:hypothetical protein